MILEAQKESIVLEEGESQDSVGMSLDLDSADFLMQMLSKNIYQDAVGSLIREYTSNALDSHRKAGINEPIVVFCGQNKQGNYEFSVKDVGVGLSKDDFMSILTKYGKSTKRESKTELGCYGIGAKSGLAYSSTLYFICRKNGMESKFMMYEGEDKNTIDLLYESPTEERNGVTVIVPISNYYDYKDFVNKVKEQLAYFENVYFEGISDITNDFQIVRSEDFQWSPLCNNRALHICLDNVYYPIDFEKLGISRPIDFPVGLRFSLTDGIFPTINREAIRYTQESKKIIADKIAKVADFFVKKYNLTITEKENIEEIFSYYRDSARYIDGYNSNKLDVTKISQYSKVKFKEPVLKNVSHLDLYKIFQVKDYLVREYDIKYYYDYKRFKANKRVTGLDYRDCERAVYVFSEEISKKKQTYLREFIGKKMATIVKKTKTIPLGDLKSHNTGYNNWITILNLKSVPKVFWRTYIKEAQYIQSLIVSKFIDIDKVEIPSEWIESQKKTRVYTKTVREKKAITTITSKRASALERYVSGKNCKYESYCFEAPTIYKNKYVTVYSLDTEENKSIIDQLHPLFDGRHIQFIVLSEKEYKKIESFSLHNLIKLEEFSKGNNIFYKRMVTAHLVNKLGTMYSMAFTSPKLKQISKSLYEKCNALSIYRYAIKKSDNIPEYILKRAEKNKWYHEPVYSNYLEAKKQLEKLKFINDLFSRISNYKLDEISYIVHDLCKYHKFRMNWENYIKKQEINKEEDEII